MDAAITPSQLFGWRGAAAKRASQEMATLPTASPQRIEIEIAGAVVRVAADIAEEDLRRILRAVREA